MVSPYRIAATLNRYHLALLAIGLVWCLAMSFSPQGATLDWILLLAAECLYQVFGPDMKAVKAEVDLKTLKDRSTASWQARVDAGARLLGDSHQGYQSLLALEREVQEYILTQPSELKDVLTEMAPKVGHLVRQYLRLGKDYSVLQEFINRSNPTDLEVKVKNLQADLAPVEVPAPGKDGKSGKVTRVEKTPEVKAILTKRLAVVQARLDKIRSAREQLPILEAQMGSVSELAHLLRDQVMAPMNSTGVRIVDLDALMKDVQTDLGVSDIRQIIEIGEDAEAEMETLTNMHDRRSGS